MLNGHLREADALTPAPLALGQQQTITGDHTRPGVVPDALVMRLNQPLPPEAIVPHPTKSYLSSIKTIYQIERLNQVFGIGGWRARAAVIEAPPPETGTPEEDAKPHPGMIVLKVTLTVPAFNIELEQFGGNDNPDRGDAYKGAYTDALGKIAAMMGIGMDVYKGYGPTKNEPRPRRAPVQPAPIAPAPQGTVTVPPSGTAGRQIVQAPVDEPFRPNRARWFSSTRDQRLKAFATLQQMLPLETYNCLLEDHGVQTPSQFKSAGIAWSCFEKMWAMAAELSDPTSFQHFLASEVV